ncbi:MAG: DUF1343 domain-containing protein [Planctomycetes bacterium]|nr:DUF1343 domain-containing protein [Planctomycetota bacterium]
MTFALGLEVCAAEPPAILRGRRFGLLMNQASVDDAFRYAHAVLDAALPGQLVALFSPQHGFFSEQQDNMIESGHAREPRSGVPIHSLYSEHRKPTPDMLDGVEVLVVDLQDVGTRVYTFIWTIALCMEACAAKGIPVLVLDRPNPLGGEILEGPLLDPDFTSFVGGAAIPMRHALTVGEMTAFLNASLGLGAQVEVVPMRGWTRRMLWSDTGRPWLPPSPNLPRFEGVLCYPGQVLLEGTLLSEGRGTTTPFEVLGAPFVDPARLLDEVQALPDFPSFGVTLRAVRFEPTFQKCAGQSCGGVFLHPDPRRVRSYRLTLALLWAVRRLWPMHFAWRQPPYEYENDKLPIDILTGNEAVRQQIEAGVLPTDTLREEAWRAAIAPHLLY